MGQRLKDGAGYAYCHFCNKQLYRDRKEARKAARSNHPGSVLNAYSCPLDLGWHYGNLPTGGRKRARCIQRAKLNATDLQG